MFSCKYCKIFKSSYFEEHLPEAATGVVLSKKGVLKKFSNFTGMEKLKVQSCKLRNSKYMIASAQVANTEIFTFIAVLAFKLLSRKVLFINKQSKGNKNC